MTLWKRAAGAIKDRSSLLVTAVSLQSSRRNPDLEAAIIRATGHGGYHFDYKNAHIVFSWIRASPLSLRPLICSLENRMERTRSWVVALKGLILLHGVLHCGVPVTRQIGKLQFDMSGFTDRHSKPSESWGFNVFIRNYYSFLEQRCGFAVEQRRKTEESVVQEMQRLRKLQNLLDLLLQIRPIAGNMKVGLIFEAMDCVIVEIFNIYSKICGEIARLLVKIDSSRKAEVSMALQILQRETKQGEELSKHFEFCKDFGVLNAKMKDFQAVKKIPEEDIQELQRIINGGNAEFVDKAMSVREENREVERVEEKRGYNGEMKTVITNKWEVFEEHFIDFSGGKRGGNFPIVLSKDDHLLLPPLLPVDLPPCNYHEIPDLISF